MVPRDAWRIPTATTAARGPSRRRRAALAAGVALPLLLAGCTSGSGCQGASTRGWFSGWSTGNTGTFSTGLGRVWGECPGTSRSVPALSADPTTEPRPGGLAPPR